MWTNKWVYTFVYYISSKHLQLFTKATPCMHIHDVAHWKTAHPRKTGILLTVGGELLVGFWIELNRYNYHCKSCLPTLITWDQLSKQLHSNQQHKATSDWGYFIQERSSVNCMWRWGFSSLSYFSSLWVWKYGKMLLVATATTIGGSASNLCCSQGLSEWRR